MGPIRKKEQGGRSTAEMIFIIIIMAFLSLVTVAGIYYGTLLWRASATITQIRKRAVVVVATFVNNKIFDLSEFPLKSKQGFPMVPGEGSALDERKGVAFRSLRPEIYTRSEFVFTIGVRDIPVKLCPHLIDLSDNYYILDVENSATKKALINGASPEELCIPSGELDEAGQPVVAELTYYFPADPKQMKEVETQEPGDEDCDVPCPTSSRCCDKDSNKPYCSSKNGSYACVQCRNDSDCKSNEFCCGNVCHEHSSLRDDRCCKDSVYNASNSCCDAAEQLVPIKACGTQVWDGEPNCLCRGCTGDNECFGGDGVCCGQQCYNKQDGYVCCGNTSYVKKEVCCGNDVLSNGQVCCGDSILQEGYCCNSSGQSVQVRNCPTGSTWKDAPDCECYTCSSNNCSGTCCGNACHFGDGSCCGDTWYQGTDKECCGNTWAEPGMCCNGVVMKEGEVCCGGTTIVDENKCCNDVLLADNQVCCYDQDLQKDVVSFVVKYSTPIEKQQGGCCGYKVDDSDMPIAGEVVKEGQVCCLDKELRDKEIIVEENTCCSGEVIHSGEECCGRSYECKTDFWFRRGGTVVPQGMCCEGIPLEDDEVCCQVLMCVEDNNGFSFVRAPLKWDLCCNGIQLDTGYVCCERGTDEKISVLSGDGGEGICCGYSVKDDGTVSGTLIKHEEKNIKECCSDGTVAFKGRCF